MKAKSNLIKEFWELYTKIVRGETSTGEVEVFVWDNLPTLLRSLEEAKLNVEASQKAARAYCDELDSYKKALEECRSQRNALSHLCFSDLASYSTIEDLDEEIDQILKSEAAE